MLQISVWKQTSSQGAGFYQQINGKEYLSVFTYAAAYVDGTSVYGSAAGSPYAPRLVSICNTIQDIGDTCLFLPGITKGITGQLQTSDSGGYRVESTESTDAYTGFATAKIIWTNFNGAGGAGVNQWKAQALGRCSMPYDTENRILCFSLANHA